MLLVLVGAVFCVSACMVFGIVSQSHREQENFAQLEEIVQQAKAASSTAQESSAGNIGGGSLAGDSGTRVGEEIPSNESSDADDLSRSSQAEGLNGSSESSDFSSPYSALKERNPDFWGWISVEDTELNYPVMYTPEDEEYYLRRDFDGNDSQGGVPFLAANCYEGCGNYLIYGHNMNDGSMFASLLSYADQEFWEQHPRINLDTLSESGSYEVLAAFYSKVHGESEPDAFRYYQYTDLHDPAVFNEYVDHVMAEAIYDTGVRAQCGDELLTLSTCSYHTDNGRFVVVARKV